MAYSSTLSVCRFSKRSFMTVLILFGLAGCHFIQSLDVVEDADRPIVTLDVEAVKGQDAHLPCEIKLPSNQNEKLQMVFWFRQNEFQPFYRFDSRDFAKTKRWSTEDRFYFNTLLHPAYLSIQSVEAEDAGIYRCRVDYKNSPTKNNQINLTVIVPPDDPVIYDANGKEIDGTVGPLKEGGRLVLICEVSGGYPKPSVKWWLENEMLDFSLPFTSEAGSTGKRLDFGPVERKHLNSKFLCSASNTNESLPKTRYVRLNLNLPPVSISLKHLKEPIMENEELEISCEVKGSRPPPTISWWQEGRQCETMPSISILDDGNLTRSTLKFASKPQDDGKKIFCRAENSHFEATVLEQFTTLAVLYKPILKLRAGNSINLDNIIEGDGLYLRCEVQANPFHQPVKWFFNGNELNVSSKPVAKSKIFTSNDELILKHVVTNNSGTYSCSTANKVGKSQSNKVVVKVKSTPSCQWSDVKKIDMAVGENLLIPCQVQSHPSSSHFYWQLKENKTITKLKDWRQDESKKNLSWLNFTLHNDSMIGTLTCWAKNQVGSGSSKPCQFQVVKNPSRSTVRSPRLCTIYSKNNTVSPLYIHCEEGSTAAERTLIFNFLDKKDVVIFSIKSKKGKVAIPDEMLNKIKKVMIFAQEGSILSEPVTINWDPAVSFAKHEEVNDGIISEQRYRSSKIMIGALIATLSIVSTLIFCAICIVCKKKEQTNHEETIGKRCNNDERSSFNSLSIKSKVEITTQNEFQDSLAVPSMESILDPDVIPLQIEMNGKFRNNAFDSMKSSAGRKQHRALNTSNYSLTSQEQCNGTNKFSSLNEVSEATDLLDETQRGTLSSLHRESTI